MSRHTRSLTARRRDAGLRRLRIANRALIGAAVVFTGLLSDVAANAFPGHKRRVVSTPATTDGAQTPAPATAATHHRRHHARHHHALRRPAQAPSSSQTPTTTSAPAPAPATTSAPPATTSAVPQSTPAPAPAPAPVVSGGS